MIILNSQKDNRNIKEIIEKYEKTLNFGYMKCPHCDSCNLIRWGTYKRNAIYIDNNAVVYKVITIQRMKCKNCNKTHALLPSYIIPYKINLLDIVLSSLINEDVALGISIDTITKWNKQFNKFLPYLKTMLNLKTNEEIITKLKSKIFEYYKLFYKQFKKILMMTRKGIYNMAYFKNRPPT